MPQPSFANQKTNSLLWICLAYGLAAGVALVAGSLLPHDGPLLVAGVADLAGTLVVFGFSRYLNNSSVYDPYWSVAPPLLFGYWIWIAPGPCTGRAAALLILSSLWGVRLTANWVRRWRGLTEEDWRYVDIRRKTGRGYWPASLVGIHLMPTVLVFAGSVAAYPATISSRPWGVGDTLGFAVTLAAIALETLADEQLRRFSGSRGELLRTGLWRWLRHPNYTGELLFWWGLYFVGLAADPSWWWTLIGPVALTGLFVAISVPLKDQRMATRYPAYAQHQARTPALVPWPKLGRRL